MRHDPAIRAGALLALVCSASCALDRGDQHEGHWPPEDFELEVRRLEIKDGVPQVRASARISSDGLVVYREADESLRSDDGSVVLPVFSRMCAYRMHWRSVRLLARDLHKAPVLELERAAARPRPREDARLVSFHLTYMANRIDFLVHGQAVGLANYVLRIVNQYLPPGHSIQVGGETFEDRLLDVPPVTDSLEGALGYHEKWLAAQEDDPTVLRDTFSLACRAGRWELAEDCVSRLTKRRPDEAPPLRRLLAEVRARAGHG